MYLNKIFLLAIATVSFIGLNAFKYYQEVQPSTSPCHPDTVYFQKQILPILLSNCAVSGCHNTNNYWGSINFTTYTNGMSTGKVKAGKPNDSDLYKAIIEKRMPPYGSLAAAETALIEKWIQQGALDLPCSSCDSVNVSYSGTISPIIQNNCAGCHSGEYLGLNTYNGVKTVALNGKLYGSVSHTMGYLKMPEGGNKLSDCELAAIYKWVQAGAPEN